MNIPKRHLSLSFIILAGLFAWLLPATAAQAAGAAVSVVPAPPACASVGSTATISGSGYGLSSGPIQVWIDQTQVVNTTPSSVQVKSDGTWTASFTVPGTVDGQQVTKQTTYPLYGIGLPDRSSTPFCIVPSSPTVSVGRAYTTGGSPTEKTAFAPGDSIWYVVNITVVNAPATMSVRWQATGPSPIYDYTNKAVTLNQGTFAVYSPATIPANAPSGTYTPMPFRRA